MLHEAAIRSAIEPEWNTLREQWLMSVAHIRVGIGRSSRLVYGIDLRMRRIKRFMRKKPSFGTLSSARSLNDLSAKARIMSSTDSPAAYMQAMTLPALTPATTDGFMPHSSRAFSAPTWANPRAPPPLSAMPNVPVRLLLRMWCVIKPF